MADENTGLGGGTASVSPSLDEAVNQMMGDVAFEMPGSTEGAPPSASSESTGSTEGSEVGDGTGTAEAPSTETTDTPADAEAPTTDDDPLAGAVPLEYTVDGQIRTSDFIQRLGKDGGAFVTPENVAKLAQRLSERDHLYERGQQQFQQYQQLESRHKSLESLTTWNYKNREGQTITLTGPDAVMASRADSARKEAALQVLGQAFQGSPVNLLAQDEAGNIIWNPEAIKQLSERAKDREENAVLRVRTQFQDFAARPAPAAAPEPLTTERLAEMAPSAVEIAAQAANIAGLSPDSLETLKLLAPRFIRSATPAELKASPNHPHVVDEAFVPVVQRVFAQQGQVAKAASSAADAEKENAKRLAAAAGKPKTKPAVPGAVVRSPTVQQNRQKDAEDAWDIAERAQVAAIRSSHARNTA